MKYLRGSFEYLKKKHLIAILFLLLLALPLILAMVFRIQDVRTKAALPDQLEAEQGVLSSSGVSKQSDSNASGGNFVLFEKQIPTNTPAPTSPPSTSGQIYGPGIAIDDKYNIRIGESGNQKLSHRFKAKTTSRAVSITWETRRGDGYSMGDGGTFKISIQTDDGSTNHYPSGQILDSVTFNPTNSGRGNLKNFFPNRPLLTEGQIYHVVWENIHPNYQTNYISVNDVWVVDNHEPRQPNPEFSGDYAVIVQRNGSWGYKTDHYSKYTAVMDLEYENGIHEGMAYVYPFYEGNSSDTEIVARIEGERQARELFTLQGGNKTVTGAGARAGREYGSGSLTISLKDSSGNTLGSGSVPASSFSFIFNNYTDINGLPNGDWVSVEFSSPITLIDGQIYQLVMTAPSGTRYAMVPLRYIDGADIPFESYAFREGRAQLSRNGGESWENNYDHSPESNYQFYLTLQ